MYHFLGQLWLDLGVKLMEINSNGCFPGVFFCSWQVLSTWRIRPQDGWFSGDHNHGDHFRPLSRVVGQMPLPQMAEPNSMAQQVMGSSSKHMGVSKKLGLSKMDGL